MKHSRLAKFTMGLMVGLLLAPSISFGDTCNERIAFISLPGSAGSALGLQEMQAPLLKLKKEVWHSRSLKFVYTTNDLSDLDALVNEVEAKVTALESAGTNRIGLPSFSVFLNPFIFGTAGSLGGVNLKTRHPNSVFVTNNNGTPAVDDLVAASNVFRFLDVPTSISDTVQEDALLALLGASGEVLIIYEDGDAVSESVKDDYVTLAANIGHTSSIQAVAFDDPLYNTLDEAAAASAIAALPAGSVVVHVANGAHQEAYTLSGISDGGIFVASSNNGPIRHFAGNYFPEASTIPVPLELGYALVDNPSRITERIGFPTHYDAWLVDPRQKLYIEAYGFLAKCGRFDGVLDHFLAFDAGGTRIQKQLEQSYLPANSLVPTWGVRIDNNRWYTEQVAWPWVQVFGH